MIGSWATSIGLGQGGPVWRVAVIAAVFVCGGAAAQDAPPIQWPIVTTVQTVTEGVAIQIPIDAMLTLVPRGAAMDARLELEAGLADVQAQATALLRAHLARDGACSDRIAIDHGQAAPDPPEALVMATIQYGHTLCFGDGADRVTAQIVPDTAGAVAMRVRPDYDANDLIIRYRLESAAAEGELGRLLALPQVDALLRKAFQLERRIPIADMMPPGFAHVRPQITALDFATDDAGALALKATVEAPLTQSDLDRLMALAQR